MLNPDESDPGKGAAGKPGKKDDKKAAKKEPAKEEVKEELSPLKTELNEALSVSKANLRYRIELLKQFSYKSLSEMRDQACKLYTSFEELIEYSYKVEVESLDEMVTKVNLILG